MKRSLVIILAFIKGEEGQSTTGSKATRLFFFSCGRCLFLKRSEQLYSMALKKEESSHTMGRENNTFLVIYIILKMSTFEQDSTTLQKHNLLFFLKKTKKFPKDK